MLVNISYFSDAIRSTTEIPFGITPFGIMEVLPNENQILLFVSWKRESDPDWDPPQVDSSGQINYLDDPIPACPRLLEMGYNLDEYQSDAEWLYGLVSRDPAQFELIMNYRLPECPRGHNCPICKNCDPVIGEMMYVDRETGDVLT
jgi:hypothetical protein